MLVYLVFLEVIVKRQETFIVGLSMHVEHKWWKIRHLFAWGDFGNEAFFISLEQVPFLGEKDSCARKCWGRPCLDSLTELVVGGGGASTVQVHQFNGQRNESSLNASAYFR